MTQYRSSLSIIKRLSPTAFGFEQMSKEDFVKIALACEAYWIHRGDPAEPHAELTSGFCSNGYLNLMKILQHSNLSQILARQVINTLPKSIDLGSIDWVLGSAYTATGLSKDVANLLGVQWAPLRKDVNGEQLCTHAAFSKAEKILHVEDLVTTGKSLLSADNALRKTGPDAHIIPVVPVLAFRPAYEAMLWEAMTRLNIHVNVLFDFNEFWVCPPSDCVLCQQGSKPLKPKSNWSLFSNI